MCGIVGYIGINEAGPVLLNGLRKLEYRGYDSAGIAVAGSEITVRKGVGGIEAINAVEDFASLKGSVGIGHSRWATHGRVSKENAHPHLDCRKEIAVVHNGIIENYAELREQLRAAGHVFRSETDSEVIPHLIEEHMDDGKTFEDAVKKSAKKLKGSFALLVLYSKEPDKLIALRNEAPLVLGIAEEGVFAASDCLPFLHSTKKAIFMNDGELAVLSKGGVKHFDFRKGHSIQKQVQQIEWDGQSAGKEGLPHFMLKEIYEAPAATRNALAQEANFFQAFAEELKKFRKVFLLCCGTSYHAALVGKYLLSKNSLEAEPIIASEFPNFVELLKEGDLVLAISQSGETADVLQGIKRAREKGARIFSIVNVVGSSIARESEKTIYLNCGPEIGVASTKAFVAQLTLFYLVHYALKNELEKGKEDLKEISNLIKKLIEESEPQIKEIAKDFAKKQHVYFIGRGVNYPIALEGALKLKEISYVHAEGMPAGELKHGTLALIEEGIPAVVLNPKDGNYGDCLSNGLEIKARGGTIIGVSDLKNAAYDKTILLPQTQELFYPLLATVPLQLIAYWTAVERGNNPDKPRNLAKSVTVK
ncbi:glutamine--fructose-6-phosphate transaminase (isomerizing) [Candidatus Micrarchaeota archaeon]|nr:glutamine--fructose-6-phosphate transaminase (isomerizing) [Candidatus Micrarchaeota archaeon]